MKGLSPSAPLVPELAAPVLRARGLALGYGNRPILHAVDLSVQRGDFWFLLGPNGSGKSTFLRAALGVISPLAGELDLAMERRKIGFVPQRCDFKPTLPMTVSEFVRLGLAGSGASRSEAGTGAAWALDMVGLPGMRDRDYWSLSGGQRQRVLVARGLVRRPELLVLDEPTNGLDLAAEESLLHLVDDLRVRGGLTVLLVTHAILLATRFATHAALFHDGAVLSGPAATVLTEQNLGLAYGVEVRLGGGARSTGVAAK